MFKKIFNCSGYIENIYDELIKLDKEGLIKLYLYPNRPDYVPIDNSDLIPKVLRWYKKGFNINNFYNIYPELKDKKLCLYAPTFRGNIIDGFKIQSFDFTKVKDYVVLYKFHPLLGDIQCNGGVNLNKEDL